VTPRPTAAPAGHGARDVFAAIRGSWTLTTTADPERWSPERPAIGQCDVSSFVAWQYLGGDLVLCEVLVDGQRQEHHYVNRFAEGDVDLTLEQFDGHEDIVELAVLSSDEVSARSSSMRPELATRIDAMRTAVASRLVE